MLPKNRRLPRGSGAFRAKGRRVGIFFVKAQPNTLGFTRFSVVAPAVILKKAVVRNLWKRLLYDSLREVDLGSGDIVLYITKEAAMLSPKEAASVLPKLLYNSFKLSK